MGTAFLMNQNGGTDTSDATAAATDILSSKTAYVNGNKITGNIASKTTATITPTTTDKTIAANQFLSGVQTIKGDANLVTGNIKSGVSIFGVSGKSSVVETSDATAIASYILANYTAYVNGSKLTGSMINNGALGTITLTTNGSSYTIPSGYSTGGSVIASFNGKSFASGSKASSGGLVTVTGLTFQPDVVVMHSGTNMLSNWAFYSGNGGLSNYSTSTSGYGVGYSGTGVNASGFILKAQNSGTYNWWAYSG